MSVQTTELVGDTSLATEKVGKLLLKYSIPAIIGMVVNMLYNVVDRIYIGNIPHVGELAITGVGITSPITTMITGLGLLIGAGCSANISLNLGSRDKEKAQRTLNVGFVLTLIMSVIIAVFGNLFAVQLTGVFGATENTMPFALQYLRPLMFGAIFNLIAFNLNTSISADGNPKVAMKTMIIGAAINIILDPIFIFGFKMGIRGAAYATVISQGVASLWVLLYFIRSKKSMLKLNKETFCFDKKLVAPILMVGLAPCLMQIATSCVQLVSNNALLKHGGDMAIGALAVMVAICSIFIMPVYGLNQGAQPIIGYNFAAGNMKRVKQTYLLGLTWCTIVLALSYAAIFFFPEILISMFNSEGGELADIALNGIRLYLCVVPLIGVQMTATNYFQATGRPKFAMIIGLTRQVLFFVPALLILPNMFGLRGVWMSGALADGCAVTLSAVIMIFELLRLNKHKEPSEVQVEAE